MRIILSVLTFILLLHGSSVFATEAKVPACPSCSGAQPPIDNKTKEELAAISKEAPDECSNIKPENRLSRIERSQAKTDPSIWDTFLISGGMQTPFVSCLYGAIEGVITNFKDIILFVVKDIWVMSWEASKWVAKKSYETASSWFKSFGPQFTEAAAVGAAGQLSAEQLAHPETTASKVMDFMKSAVAAVKELVSTEANEFMCLTGDAKQEYVCKAVAYLTIDFLSGKIAVSAVTKVPIVAAAAKKSMILLQELPGIKKAGQAALPLRRLAGETDELKKANWVPDPQKAGREVAVLNSGKVVVKEPVKVRPGAFQKKVVREGEHTFSMVANEKKAAELAKLHADELAKKSTREAKKAAAKVDETTRFHPLETAKQTKTSPADHIQRISRQLGRGMTPSEAKSVADKLAQSPKYADEYAELAKLISERRKPLTEALTKDLLDGKVQKSLLEQDLAHTKFWDEVNHAIAKMDKKSELNLPKIIKDLKASTDGLDPAQVAKSYERILKEIRHEKPGVWSELAGGKKKNVPEADSFTRKAEHLLDRAKKANVPQEVIDQARNCLIRPKGRVTQSHLAPYSVCEF